MFAGQEAIPDRPVFGQQQYRFRTEVSRSCFILGDSDKDIGSIRVDLKPPPGASIQISKDFTRAPTRLNFALPSRLTSKGEEIRSQCRYILAQGQLASASSLLVTDESGKGTPVAATGPAHTSTWQGQTMVSAHFRLLTDVATTCHDRLVWSMELDTDPVSCDLIDVTIAVGDCWRVYGGAELLRGEAALRDGPAISARDDLAGLIQMFETQYHAWARTRRELLDEIEYLRRSLDEAQQKQAPASNRG